jgi:hypothetical protein
MTAMQTLFTDSYSKFTRWVSRIEVRKEANEQKAKIRVPEKTVRCIWNDQLFKTDSLSTTDGRALEIIFQGYWNFGPGPDFKNAVIKVNGKTLEGDVEVHTHSSDREKQGQFIDPEYGNVILNVFLWNSDATVPSETGLHQLELKEHLTRGILDLNAELDFDSFPDQNQVEYGQCHQPLAGLSKEKLTSLLNAAGDARVFTKMERFNDRVIINGYEQTFYEGIAEALGYPNNKEPFQKLAGAVRLNTLKELLPKKISKAEKVLHIQSLMFGVAGLIGFKALDKSALTADDRGYFEKLQNLWEKKYRSRAPFTTLTGSAWKFGGIRPANYPWRRIAGLAHLLVSHEENGLFADYMKIFQENMGSMTTSLEAKSTASIPGKLNDYFCIEADDDYFASHYTPGGKLLAKPQLLVGATRSQEITVNIVIPIGLIFARASKSEKLETSFNVLFQSGKKPGDNKLLRFMKHYIFGNKKEMLKVLKNDKQGQGLMQIYQDFCTQNDNNCQRCQFPDIVKKYFS